MVFLHCKDIKNGWISQPSHSKLTFKTKTILTAQFTEHRKYTNFSLPLHCLLPPHRIAHIGIRPPRLDSSGRGFYLSITKMIFAIEIPVATPAKNISHSICDHQGSFSLFFIIYSSFLALSPIS